MMIDAPEVESPLAFVVPDNDESREGAAAVVNALRAAGIPADYALQGKVKKHFEMAKRSGAAARLVVIKAAEDGIPERVGLHVRVNQIGSFERESAELRDWILNALEQRFRVNRFEPTDSAWSPDAVLQVKSA